MKSCLLCPKGKKCRGYVLSELILKLYDAVERGDNADAIARQLTREDMELLNTQGDKARITCWSKGFVMVIARKVADLTRTAEHENDLRVGMERLVVQVDSLFSKLPKGLSIDLADLVMDIYNNATEILATEGGTSVVPATILGKIVFDAARGA